MGKTKENITPQPEEQQDLRERAVVVAVIRDGQPIEQAEEFLGELEFLAETADIVTVRRFTQRLPQPSSRIYVGPGKLEEIAKYCEENEIDVVIFDDELSPSQTILPIWNCTISQRNPMKFTIVIIRLSVAFVK